MNGTLNLTVKIVAYADPQVSSQPRLKFVDWLRDMASVPVIDPKSEGHQLQAGETKTIFDGTRATTLNGTTAFDVTLSPLDPSRYRFTYSAGTDPTLRAARNLTPSGIELTFAVNANATVTLSSASPVFSGVLAGDSVFIPNTTTGDSANVISVINSGYWQVLQVSSTSLITLIRFAGADFEAENQVVTPASNTQLRAYGPTGVQIGDSVDLSAGFSTATLQTFEVVAVTDKFFEIISTTPLPAEAGILPTASGMVFYTDTKSFLYIESTQEIAVRTNGETGSSQRVQPVEPNESSRVGTYMKRGPTWSLVLVNRSTSQADVTVISGE
jgi:hypothetical protein